MSLDFEYGNRGQLLTPRRQSYQYILKALRTFDPKDSKDVSSTEAQTLSLRALKAALLSNTHYDFHDLTSLPAIQALSDSQPIYSELLEIFSEKELEDYNDFRDEHEGFLEKEALDNSKLHRKMRLLTMASLGRKQQHQGASIQADRQGSANSIRGC